MAMATTTKKEEYVRPNPFILSNTEISKHIIGIHDSSVAARYDVLSLFNHLVNHIMNSTRIGESLQQKIKSFRSAEVIEDKIGESNIMPSARKLKQISCKMICHSFNAQAAHETVVWILEKLRKYSWDAKAVIALAAFAMDYGEPWRLYLMQNASESSVLEVHLFKFGGEEISRQAYNDQFKTLLDPTLQLIRGLIELEDLINDKTYSRKDLPTLYTVQRETYTYWAIFALLACAGHITEWEWGMTTSEIVRKINVELTNLNLVLKECKAQIDELKDYKWRLWVFENPSGVVELLKAMIYPRNYSPLETYDNSSMETSDSYPRETFNNFTTQVVPLDVLKSRYLLLFISPLETIEDEIWPLKTINKAFRRDPDKQDYSIFWVPIVEPSRREEDKLDYGSYLDEERLQMFEFLRDQMPWYVTKYFPVVNGIKAIRNEWFYQDKPIVVVVNPRGEVINKNAMHMIFVWNIKAFPFRPEDDAKLSRHWQWFWNEASQLNQLIRKWIDEDNYIFIYEPAEQSDIPAGSKNVELVLEGIKRDPITRKADVSIQYYNLKRSEHNSKFWDDIINLFMTKINKENAEQDPSLKEVEKLLSLKEHGWILVSKGRNVLIQDNSAIMSSVLAEYDIWKSDVVQKQGFDNAFVDYYRHKRAQSPLGCSHLHLRNIRSGEIPLNVYCPESTCPLKMLIASINYNCCHGEHKHGPEATEINVQVPMEK